MHAYVRMKSRGYLSHIDVIMLKPLCHIALSLSLSPSLSLSLSFIFLKLAIATLGKHVTREDNTAIVLARRDSMYIYLSFSLSSFSSSSSSSSPPFSSSSIENKI